LDSRRRFLRSQRARCLRPRRSLASKRETHRRSHRHHRRTRPRLAGSARGPRQGRDRAIHLEDDAFVGLDAYNTARAIAAAVKDEKFDLIFTGLQSDDYGYAQTGVILAQILAGRTHHHHADRKNRRWHPRQARARSRILSIRRHPFTRRSDHPVGHQQLRYATLIGIKQAKNKPLRKVALAEVQSAMGENLQKIVKLYVPQKSKNTEFLEGPPAEVAKKLVEKAEKRNASNLKIKFSVPSSRFPVLSSQ